MEPINFYLAFVSTIGVLILVGFFTRWWYGEYVDLKSRRSKFWRCPALDDSILMHKATLLAVCCASVVAIFYVWVSAAGEL